MQNEQKNQRYKALIARRFCMLNGGISRAWTGGRGTPLIMFARLS
jgi:hypothetical protein